MLYVVETDHVCVGLWGCVGGGRVDVGWVEDGERSPSEARATAPSPTTLPSHHQTNSITMAPKAYVLRYSICRSSAGLTVDACV